MDREWNDSQPIYRQLRDRVVEMILDGDLKEGDDLVIEATNTDDAPPKKADAAPQRLRL